MPNKRPNHAAIEAEIAALDDCKKFIPHFTKFNDDNFAAVDAGVSALADRLTVDLAYELAGEDEPSSEDQAKIEAALWLAGERDTSPSADWQEYRPKVKA